MLYRDLELYLSLIIVTYCCGACGADLYQVNTTRTLCFSDVAEFMCSQHDSFVVWIVTSISTGERSSVLSLDSSALHTGQRMVRTTIDSTEVIAQLLDGNSSFSLTVLTIEATLSASVRCNADTLNYYPQNSKTVVHYNGGLYECKHLFTTYRKYCNTIGHYFNTNYN